MPEIIKETAIVYCIYGCEYGDWADITLKIDSEKAGRISISSSLGSWSNYWSAAGPNFKSFLTELNVEYAADKFNADNWFDLDATIEHYKAMVLQARRQETISGEHARLCWQEIEDVEGCSNEGEFVSEMWTKKGLMSFFDGTPDLEKKIKPQFERFWKNVWPHFIDCLKTELANEPN